MRITVEIPDELASAMAHRGDLARALLEDHIAQAYREGKLTLYEVQGILGLPTRMHVDPFLARYEIYDYTLDDFRQDVATLKRLRQHA